MYPRRTVVGAVVGAVVLVVLWVLRGFIGSPSVGGTEPELRPGTSSAVDIKARNAGGLVFTSLPNETAIRIDLNEATLSPRPSFEVDTYPPYWYWRIPRQSISVEVPVVVNDDAEPGVYHYAVRAYDSSDRDTATSVTEAFAITVIDR